MRNRLVKGFAANGFGQIISIFIQLVSIPIFLRSWGNELYGEWLILSAIPTYLSLSDLGFTTAAANEMTMKVAEQNKKSASKIYQSMSFFITLICIIMPFFIIVTLMFLPINTIFNLKELDRVNASLIIAFLSLYVLTIVQRDLLVAGFRCDKNYALGRTYLSLLRFFEYLGVTIVVLYGCSPTLAALFFWIFCVLGLLIMKFSLNRRSPWLFQSKGETFQDKVDTIVKLSKPAVSSICFPLGNGINNQGITIAIGSILGSKEVVIFSVLRTLSRLSLQAMGTIKNSVSPEISAAYAQGDIKTARKLHRYSSQLSLLLGFVVISFLLIFGEKIISIWTHKLVEFDFLLFVLMLINILVGCLWYTSIEVVTSTNNHQRVAIVYVLSSLFSIILSVKLLPILGLIGAALALMFFEVIVSVFVLKSSLKLLNDNLYSYIKSLFKIPMIY